MRVGDLCTRQPETTSATETVREAARRMSERDVGSLVVINGSGEAEGIVTDRDIVIRCVAKGTNSATMMVSEVMTPGAASINEDARAETALEFMAHEEVRRLVVVDDQGLVVGIACLDDFLSVIVDQTEDIGHLLRQQVHV